MAILGGAVVTTWGIRPNFSSIPCPWSWLPLGCNLWLSRQQQQQRELSTSQLLVSPMARSPGCPWQISTQTSHFPVLQVRKWASLAKSCVVFREALGREPLPSPAPPAPREWMASYCLTPTASSFHSEYIGDYIGFQSWRTICCKPTWNLDSLSHSLSVQVLGDTFGEHYFTLSIPWSCSWGSTNIKPDAIWLATWESSCTGMSSVEQGRLSPILHRSPGGSCHAPHSLGDVPGLFGTC